MAIFSKFFGRTIGEAAAFALGGAMRSPLEPPLVELTNETWARFVDKGITVPTDPDAAAEIAAEDVATVAWAKDQAKQRGYGGDQMDKLIGAVLNAPGLGPLFQMWRRRLITDKQFEHGLRKAKLETEWDKPLQGLHDVLLSSEELAMMQQQGFVGEDRANREGALQGVTDERQQLRFEASGLPPGVETGLEMLRRSIVDEETFAAIVREGHTKTKYTPALLRLKDRVLSAASFSTLRLKGWITPEESYAGGALTGYTREQMDLLYLEHGRPATTHQVFIGNRRGGHVGDSEAGIDPDFLKAVIQSDIRPEYAPVLWAQRYTYPAAFVLRTLTQSGDISGDEAETILLYEGWEPALAKTVSAKWAQGATATTSGASKKAETSLLTALHSAYVNDRETETTARAALAFLNVEPADADRTIAVWNRERQIVRSALTAAQIKKAIGQPNRDKAWALERLAELGYTPADAETFLSE